MVLQYSESQWKSYIPSSRNPISSITLSCLCYLLFSVDQLSCPLGMCTCIMFGWSYRISSMIYSWSFPLYHLTWMLRALQNWQTTKYRDSCKASILVWDIQWKLGIMRFLGLRNFVCCIRYFVISVVNKQYKTRKLIHWDRKNLFVISGILLYQISLYWVSTV